MNATPERRIVKKISCHSGWCNSGMNTQKNGYSTGTSALIFNRH